MLRCGHCSVICECYEDWLAHLVTEAHQSKLGMSEVFQSHKNEERNERSFLLFHMNPKTEPYQVVCHFAVMEPLGFVTDAYVHIFPNVKEKFYLLVYDQRKFVERICKTQERCGDQKVLSSVVHCQNKASLTEKEWEAKITSSFFYRRHEHLRRSLIEMTWEEQLSMFLGLVSLAQSGYQEREKVMEELESLIREEYSKATVNPFGSCTTWLADTHAELDVYVDAIGNGGKTDIDQDTRHEVIQKIRTLLQIKFNKNNVTSIKNGHIPTLKLDYPTRLKINFSFENCLFVQTSKMIRLMTKLDYRIRPFLVFLRYWTRFHNLIGPESVKSYALILMALVFLRKKKILPTVHDLQAIEGTRPCLVSGWNATFCNNREIVWRSVQGLKCAKEPPSEERIAQDVMQLVYGFFAEYAGFDFETQVICPLVGDHLPKASFESLHGVDLPLEMGLLKANLVTEQCTPFKTQRPMCIQDPFSLNVNVSSNCRSPEIIYKLKAACATAAEALKPFATVYDSADKENILDLCCQQLTSEKVEEIIKMSRKPEEDHDKMACIKAEATTTTNECEMNDPQPSNSQDTKKPKHGHGDASKLINDFNKGEYNQKSSSKSEKKDRRDRPSSSRDTRSSNDISFHRDRDRANKKSTRVKRISVDDDTDKPSTVTQPESSWSYPFALVPTGPIPSPEATTQKNEENPLKKALKSIVVVANKKGVKIKSGSETGPASSESSTSALTAAATPSPSKKSKKSKEKSKSLKAKKEKRDSKDVPKSKAIPEPVVKFIPSPATHLEKFESLLTTQASSSSSRLSTSVEQMSISTESNVSSDLSDKQVIKFVGDVEMEAPLDKIPPPKINVRFDAKAVSQIEAQKPKPKPKSNHYVPLKKRTDNQGGASGSISPSIPSLAQRGTSCAPMKAPVPNASELYFPAFAIHSSEDFQNSFCSTLENLPIYENVRLTKAKVFWVNSAIKLFFQTQFWDKIQSMLEDDSYKDVKLEQDKAQLIFEEVDRKREELLQEDGSANNPKKKRNLAPRSSSSSSEAMFSNSSEQRSTPRPSPNKSDDSTPSYELMSALLRKLVKLPSPSNIRKNYAQAYFFRCHPSLTTLVKEQWMSISTRLEREFPEASPLDMLEEICKQIIVTLPHVPPTEEWISIKMIVAFDTSGEPPGLYFGFEYEQREDDPSFDKQVGIHGDLETILKDIIPAHARHMMVKYFSDVP